MNKDDSAEDGLVDDDRGQAKLMSQNFGYARKSSSSLRQVNSNHLMRCAFVALCERKKVSYSIFHRNYPLLMALNAMMLSLSLALRVFNELSAGMVEMKLKVFFPAVGTVQLFSRQIRFSDVGLEANSEVAIKNIKLRWGDGTREREFIVHENND